MRASPINNFILKFQMSNNNKMGVSVNCTLTSVSLKSIFMTLGFRRTRRLLLIKSDLIFNPNFEQDFRSCDDFLKINTNPGLPKWLQITH